MFLLDKLKSLFTGASTAPPETHEPETNVSEANTAESTQDLSTMKVVELRDIAKKRGLKGYTKLKKAELVNLLLEV